ncbi:MAG: hypothetical protein R2991_01330 [Thermoanaerobaculia bacterium]
MERLFHHYEGVPDARLYAPFLLARVLEDGDSSDCAALLSRLGEDTARRWLASRGGRQLSRRSRRYWSRILRVEASAAHPLAEEIWPL